MDDEPQPSPFQRARQGELFRTIPVPTHHPQASFSISELRLVYEAVWGVRLDPGNFCRKVQGVPGFITSAGSDRRATKGRPAQLFRAGATTVLHPPLARPDPQQASEESR